MNENILEKSIGSGPLFPIELKGGAWLPEKGSIQLIEDNLISILTYQVGFRIRQEMFGTRNYECLEEPNVNTTRLLIYKFTQQAVAAYEPRVNLINTQIQFDSTSIRIHLKYQVLTNQLVSDLDFSYQIN